MKPIALIEKCGPLEQITAEKINEIIPRLNRKVVLNPPEFGTISDDGQTISVNLNTVEFTDVVENGFLVAVRVGVFSGLIEE